MHDMIWQHDMMTWWHDGLRWHDDDDARDKAVEAECIARQAWTLRSWETQGHSTQGTDK